MKTLTDGEIDGVKLYGMAPRLRPGLIGRTRRYRSDTEPHWTQKQVAAMLTARGEPITRQGVCQAERRALDKLRWGLRTDPYVREYLKDHHLGHLVTEMAA